MSIEGRCFQSPLQRSAMYRVRQFNFGTGHSESLLTFYILVIHYIRFQVGGEKNCFRHCYESVVLAGGG